MASRKWNCTYKAACNSAKQRGYTLHISKEDWIVKTKHCHYCGDFIADKTGTKLDRVDNSLGYTNENTVGCCRQCNVAKNKYTLEEFKNWIKIVHSKIVYEELDNSSTQNWDEIWD